LPSPVPFHITVNCYPVCNRCVRKCPSQFLQTVLVGIVFNIRITQEHEMLQRRICTVSADGSQKPHNLL
jgi:hypothetical protein